MKKLFFYLLIFLSCNFVFSGDVRIVFTSNPDAENVTHYVVYKAEGADSTSLNFVNIGTVPHTQGGVELTFPTTFDAGYMKAGVEAINVNGPSIRSESKAYSYGEFSVPSAPLFGSPAIISGH